jgi:hypothetical protein
VFAIVGERGSAFEAIVARKERDLGSESLTIPGKRAGSVFVFLVTRGMGLGELGKGCNGVGDVESAKT